MDARCTNAEALPDSGGHPVPSTALLAPVVPFPVILSLNKYLLAEPGAVLGTDDTARKKPGS